MYTVFVRNWWRYEPGKGLVPNPRARKHTIQKGVKTEEEAQAICKRYNSTHNPGRLSRKAEYTES